MRPVKNQVKYHVWGMLLRGANRVNDLLLVQVWDGVWHHVRDQVRENLGVGHHVRDQMEESLS